MNIILFSRKQVIHRPEQLSKMLNALTRLDVDYTINEDFAQDIEQLLQTTIEPSHRFVGAIEAKGDDVVVTFGGDGTLLEAVGLLPNYSIPVVGVNCGRLGYLTVDDGSGVEELMERIVQHQLPTEQRDMLSVEGDIDCNAKCLALNEVAIHRHGATMITIEAFVNGNAVAKYHGDGLVISTPTGSTAYALSAGGPILDPTCRCFILAPLAPHNLTMRPIVVPNDNTITLKLSSRGGEAFLSADNRTYTLHDGASITLRLAHERLILATPHNNTFYDTLREKMMWGVDNR